MFILLKKQSLPAKVLKTIVSTLLVCFALVSQAALADTKGLDPTKPLFGSKQSQAVKVGKNLVLEGIFHGSHGAKTHTAVINGQSLKVNDYIGEYRLVAVNDDSVVLRSSEKRLKLSVFTSIVKK